MWGLAETLMRTASPETRALCCAISASTAERREPTSASVPSMTTCGVYTRPSPRRAA
jgi:hypothetical protein